MSKPVSKSPKVLSDDSNLKNALAKKRLDLEDGANYFKNSLELLRSVGEKDDLAKITELQISNPLVFNNLISRKSIESTKAYCIKLFNNWFRIHSSLIHRVWTSKNDVGIIHYFIELRRKDNLSDLYEVNTILDDYSFSDFNKYLKINLHFISAETAGKMIKDLEPVSLED